MDKYVVVSVSNIAQRDKLVKRIYTNLTAEPSTTLTVVQDQVNRVRVYHKFKESPPLLVKTFLVLVVPLHIDLGPMYEIVGDVTFELSETIKNVQDLLTKLKNLQGHRVMRGNTNESQFRELVSSLSRANGKY